MFRRASGLASGATASSRSRKTWSVGSPLALSIILVLDPGTARLERRDRSGRATGCMVMAPEATDACRGPHRPPPLNRTTPGSADFPVSRTTPIHPRRARLADVSEQSASAPPDQQAALLAEAANKSGLLWVDVAGDRA